MFRVTCDNYILHDDDMPDLKIVGAQLDMELNKAGSLIFTIYPDHPYIASIQKMKSTICVFQDGAKIWEGRPLNISKGFYNQLTVSCEGKLAFFNDVVMRPYEFSGDVTEYMDLLLDAYNEDASAEREILRGIVTVTDPNDYIARSSEMYPTIWELLTALTETLGGYLVLRESGGNTYLDYLEGFDPAAAAVIRFGENLLDMKSDLTGDEVCTVLIPLGAVIDDQTNERLTIASENEGMDYLEDADAIALYGRIVKTAVWDDVTVAANLLSRGRDYLTKYKHYWEHLELSAADLAPIDTTVESFRIGTYVRIISEPHDIDRSVLVRKITIYLDAPEKNILSLGDTRLSYVEQGKKQYGDTTYTMEQIRQQAMDAVAGIEVGAENLLANGKPEFFTDAAAGTLDGYFFSTETGVTRKGVAGEDPYLEITVPAGITLDDDGFLLQIQRALYYNGALRSEINGVDYRDGLTYTASCEIKTTSPVTVGFGANVRPNSQSRIRAANQAENKQQVDEGDSWQRVSWAYEIPAGWEAAAALNYTQMNFLLELCAIDGVTDLTSDVIIKLRHMQIEQATVVSDWHRAPDDYERSSDDSDRALQSQVEAVAARTSTTEDAIVAIRDTQTSITTDVNGLRTEVSGIAETLSGVESSVSTQMQQLADRFEFTFQTQSDLDTFKKYIQFVNGDIILGASDSEIKLRQENDRISFIQGDTVVAYFRYNKMYVTDGEFLNRLILGRFAFTPRENGNLSFGKVS